MNIIKFTLYPQPQGYKCNQLGDMSGEYVPLAEYQQVINLVNELGEEDVQNRLQIDKLKALIQRVNEIGSILRVNVIENFVGQHLKLVKLLKDCQEAVE